MTDRKGFKIPKGQSEALNRRKTDNAMARRRNDNTDAQNTTQKRLSDANPT